MDILYWVTIALLVAAVVVGIGGALYCTRAAARPDDWGSLISAAVIAVILMAAAVVLALVRLVIGLF